jgi:hypothetical protein
MDDNAEASLFDTFYHHPDENSNVLLTSRQFVVRFLFREYSQVTEDKTLPRPGAWWSMAVKAYPVPTCFMPEDSYLLVVGGGVLNQRSADSTGPGMVSITNPSRLGTDDKL